jgi:hypothetical protein
MQLGQLRVSGMRMTSADFVARLEALGFVLAAPSAYARDYADGGVHYIRLIGLDRAQVSFVAGNGGRADDYTDDFPAILSDFQPLVTP